MRNRFLLCVLSLMAFQPVYAQDAVPAKAPSTSEDVDAMKEKLTKKLDAMSEKMSDQEQQHFKSSYENYILINTVKTVQTDIGQAVNACGEKNADIKPKMDERFAKWNDVVNPVLKDSQGNLDNMVLAQDYASKEDMQDVFNYIDKTREVTRAQMERVYVTTPEACQKLADSMDETQVSMTKLLRQTLVTFPQLHPATGAEKKPE